MQLKKKATKGQNRFGLVTMPALSPRKGTKMNKALLKEVCVSSDSNLEVKKCWCAECKDFRSSTKKQNIQSLEFVKDKNGVLTMEIVIKN